LSFTGWEQPREPRVSFRRWLGGRVIAFGHWIRFGGNPDPSNIVPFNMVDPDTLWVDAYVDDGFEHRWDERD
jgi:hypothetical protein